ncbi:metallophosphoesterase [Maribacter sp. 2304DJ31-5]|uniref:metallophosphoesterase n=1 Tax=Maribacter sp. 2304DJ31-5 TaxID=3386273 RepID=UPI0039BD89AC
MSKTFVIGDLHGCYDEFIELSNQIGITKNDLVISLGDIVDRGNKSVELYNYFKNRENSIVLMGNHERKHQRGILSYSQEIVKVQFADEYTEFVKWTETLPYFFETNEAIIVHAFFEHDKKLQEQKQEVLSGTNSGSKYLENKYEEGKFWSDYYKGEKPIIYGHHVVGDKPKIYNNTYGIDTGACHGGKLTIIELPGFKIHQIKVNNDYWKEEQSKWQIPVLNAKNWEEMKIEFIHNQLSKLSYKEEVEIIEFLKGIENWINNVQNTIITIKGKLEEITIKLKEKHKELFNKEVAKLSYRSFIFKANSNNLQLSDLEKILNTPQKVIDLALELNLSEIPNRKSQ